MRLRKLGTGNVRRESLEATHLSFFIGDTNFLERSMKVQ